MYIPEKRSGIDKIMQGLQVAQSVYGVKSAYDQNKLNEIKMQEAEKEQSAQKRREIGEFTESEVSNLYKVPAGTKGASIGYVQKIERTPQGKAIYDEETGTPKTSLEQFHYIGKEPALIQSYLDKQAESTARINEMNIRARGGIPISDINSGKVKNWSLKPDPLKKQIQSFYIDPTNMQETPIWIDPITSKRIRTGDDGTAPKKEPPKGISPSLKAGFYSAIESGIENPSIEDMEQYSPEFVDKKLIEYKKGIDDVDIEIKDALENIDELFGIDYYISQNKVSDKTQPIEGVTTSGSWLPTKGLAGGVGRAVIGKEGTRNKAAITGLTNVLLKVRSGAAITQEEAENFKAEISAAMGADDPVALRNALVRIRNKLEAKAAKLELGFPAKVKETIYNDPRLLSTKSKLFQKKKELSDEDAADLLMKQRGG